MSCHSIKTLVLFFALQMVAATASKSEIHLEPSHDTFVRRDRGDKFYGNSSKITVTKRGSNQRIGMMKFDTSGYAIGSDGTTASLRLTVAETHDTKPVEVKVYKMINDIHEDEMTWDTFDGDVHTDKQISFTVDNTQKDQPGEIDVSILLEEGKDIVLAFVVEDEGHVKFHSKDNDHEFVPKLIIQSHEEL
eukprot:CAMPEP_0203689224 /NCGR_PEP_ID=MMETSP0091-20130426/1617_1 /ASSEMBLY_ACC=CAM_ASM_001089 /TAXON_ID=426623 /ORGANISM="Chaetoceros affinis, Strain CCMP159" /LENGTH=190 /DNA_ID=CAMNT_0050558825 /DNA_START=29 /DNA_END=601 /DNA_ORIENTATION=+